MLEESRESRAGAKGAHTEEAEEPIGVIAGWTPEIRLRVIAGDTEKELSGVGLAHSPALALQGRAKA